MQGFQNNQISSFKLFRNNPGISAALVVIDIYKDILNKYN